MSNQCRNEIYEIKQLKEGVEVINHSKYDNLMISKNGHVFAIIPPKQKIIFNPVDEFRLSRGKTICFDGWNVGTSIAKYEKLNGDEDPEIMSRLAEVVHSMAEDFKELYKNDKETT